MPALVASAPALPSKSPEAVAAELAAHWPTRKQQICQLLRLIGRPAQAGTDVFVYGVLKGGKTTIVRECLSRLGRQHAYFALGETTKPKQLFSSVLTQLQGAKRTREGGYVGRSCGDSVAEFATELSTSCPPGRPTAYVVLDGVQLIARSQTLQALLSAREVSGANVAFIFISPVPLASHWFFEGLPPRAIMPEVYFPAYTNDELADILSAELQRMPHGGRVLQPLLRRHASAAAAHPDALRDLHAALARTFVDSVVVGQGLPNVTRSVPELRAAALYLWPIYLQPLSDPNSQAAAAAARLDREQLSRCLMSKALKERVGDTLCVLQPGMSHQDLVAAAAEAQARASRGNAAAASCLAQGGRVGGHQAALEDGQTQHGREWSGLPLSAKLLVVAAFVASHNKASQDKQVFDNGRGARPKRGRKGAQAAQAADRQAEAAKEAQLRGPSPFTLPRLLSILAHLYRAAHHAGPHRAAAAMLHAQGLPALRASFVVDAAALEALGACERAHAAGARQQHAGGAAVPLPVTAAMLNHQGVGEGPPLPVAGAAAARAAAGEEEDLEEVMLADAFANAMATTGAGGARGGKKGAAAKQQLQQQQQRARQEAALAALLPAAFPGGGGGGGGGLLQARGAAVACLEPDTFVLPHPASGWPAHGSLPLPADLAPLLHGVTSLAGMGLLKQSSAEDMLEAPRYVVGACVSEALARALAADCGLELQRYLKYA